MKNRGKCTYCKGDFLPRELSLVQKYFTPLKETGEFGKNNEVVACKDCRSDKNRLRLDHHEFIKFLYKERQKKREEFYKKYPQVVEKVFEKYNYECIYCNYEYGYTPKNRKLTIDHKRSLFRRGDNDIKNLCSSCVEHNKDKGPLTAKQYFKVLRMRKKEEKNKKEKTRM